MPRESQPRSSARYRGVVRRVWPIFRFVLGLGIAALVLWVLSSHTDELTGLRSLFTHLRWWWIFPAVGVEAASYCSGALVPYFLLKAGGVKAPQGTLVGITLASQAITNSLPAGSVAAAVYGFRWFRRLGANDRLAAWSMIGNLVALSLSLALVAAAGLALATSQGATLDLIPVTIGVLLITAAIGGLLLNQRPQAAVVSWCVHGYYRLRRKPVGDIDAKIKQIVERITQQQLRTGDVLRILGWGVAVWLFDCACFAFSFLAIGAAIPWKGLLLAYGAGQLASNLPITPGGLGAVEGSITIALVFFGSPHYSTVEAVLIYRLISFWAELVVGWASAGWLALSVRSGRWRRRAMEGDPRVDALVSAVMPIAVEDRVGGGDQ